jgi:alkyldihydroxyacetonephosphate synthase
MHRWNGWGEEKTGMPLPASARSMLEDILERPLRQGPSCRLDEIVSRIPKSRIPRLPAGFTSDAKERLYHSYGQSLPDWVGFRFGEIKRFPDAVAFPETLEQVREALFHAAREDAVIIPYGGGTSVVGHLSVPESDRPVISLSLERLNRLVDIDPVSRLATFEAGVRGPYLEAQLLSHGFTLGHYPQSFELSTLGGWVATRSSGQQSLYYGRIEDLFAGGRVLTQKGDIDFPPHPASAAGPDLRQLFMGSEGRMGVLGHAQVRIREIPQADHIYGVFFPSWERGVEAVRALSGTKLPLSMLRLSNPTETLTNLALAGHERQIRLLKTYLRLRGFFDNLYSMALVALTGSRREVRTGWKQARSIISKFGGKTVGQSMGKAWKRNRFLAPYLRNTLWDAGFAVDTLETAVTWDRLHSAMTAIESELRNGLHERGEKVHAFSHLSHVYPTGSSIYTTYLFRIAETAEETLSRWHILKSAASQAIVKAGGTISHQHGVGEDHKDYLAAEKGELGIELLRNVWELTDPENRMNPEKLLPPAPPSALRQN